ncbi:unnamed protein product, partial [Symbiodinium pilosum]
KEEEARPEDDIDHRPAGGPRLTYLWCQDKVGGQTLYLGGNIGVDGKLYFIPGHAKRVMVCDPATDRVTCTGPIFPGKFKWLRGVNVDSGKIYGLPCHADTVLCIDVPSGKITTIPIPYDEVYSDRLLAKEQRECKWKYHGGTICPTDNCIYCIPQSALHVLKIDPVSETCQLVGPELPGKYKWYGGVVGKHDQAIYGIPHNSPHVLRISPSAITVHGDYGDGGHKWHGASPAPNGDIVSVPANADSVLIIRPGIEPEMFEIGDAKCVKSGRHRTDRKYKFLGAMTGADGMVYCFPSGSERVLQIDTEAQEVREVGPNLFDMERICQNKWQNGLTLGENVYAIPLAGESLLRVLDKWEGGIVAPNGVIYTDVFSYDVTKHDMGKAVISLLQQCDSDVVGSFRSGAQEKLEDFCVPAESTWRSVNGGRCEDAQRYLSEQIARNDTFLAAFDRLVSEVVLPYMKQRLVAAGVAEMQEPMKFYYQRPPTLRLQPGPARSHVKAHNDATYGHQSGELNFWLPLTDRKLTEVDLHCESAAEEGEASIYQRVHGVGFGVSFLGLSVVLYEP